MQSRFVIRTRDGQEMTPKTLEAFSDMVCSGVIRPDDMVFDALTGTWKPAGTHPMVLLFQDLMTHDPLSTSGAGDDLGLALTEPAKATPEEEAEAFIRRMEEERRHDQGVALAWELPLTDARPMSLAAASPASPALEGRETPGRTGPRPVSLPALVEASEADPPRRRRTPWGLVAAVTLVGVLVLWRPGVTPGGPAHGSAAAVNAASLKRPGLGPVAATPTVRVLTATEEEVRSEALERFGKAVDRVREGLGLGDAPETWLEGRYLADPRDYPEVPQYWSAVRSFVEVLRKQDGDLYREAYLETAEALGVAGPVRSLRMATALEDFTREAPRREEHYDRVWNLASASLALHDLLIELEGRVTHEPIRGTRLSADPVLEAAGTDPEAQSLLEVALDRVLKALPASEGLPSRDRSRLTDWMIEGVVR